MPSKKGASKKVAKRRDSLAQGDSFIGEIIARRHGDDDSRTVEKLVNERRRTSVRLRFTTEVDIVTEDLSVCDCTNQKHLGDRLCLGALLLSLGGDCDG